MGEADAVGAVDIEGLGLSTCACEQAALVLFPYNISCSRAYLFLPWGI